LIDKIVEIEPEILLSETGIEYLIREYIAKGAFTKSQIYDSAHVAYASFYEIDILLSLNYKHINNYRTKVLVESVNILNGYRMPEIMSPMQF